MEGGVAINSKSTLGDLSFDTHVFNPLLKNGTCSVAGA